MVSILGKLTYLPVLSQVFDRATGKLAAAHGGAGRDRSLHHITFTL
jgi:hypothetical protein